MQHPKVQENYIFNFFVGGEGKRRPNRWGPKLRLSKVYTPVDLEPTRSSNYSNVKMYFKVVQIWWFLHLGGDFFSPQCKPENAARGHYSTDLALAQGQSRTELFVCLSIICHLFPVVALMGCLKLLPQKICQMLCLSAWTFWTTFVLTAKLKSLSVFLSVCPCLSIFLISCWLSEQLLFWQLSWKVFISFCLSCQSVFLTSCWHS